MSSVLRITMSLDVYIQPRPELPLIGGDFEPICQINGNGSVEEEGYYWFLYPFFKRLAEQTGQAIDLYGDAFFCGEALDALAQCLVAARSLVNAQPDVWEIHVGTQFGTQLRPVQKEIYSTVDKQQMVALLDKLDAAVRKAKGAGVYVNFIGD